LENRFFGQALFILFSEGEEGYLTKIIAKSSEIIYMIVILSGLTMYDLITVVHCVSTNAFTKKWWVYSFSIFLIWEFCGVSVYSVFVAKSSLNGHNTEFLEKMYPYSAYIAFLVIVLGMITQLMIGKTEKKT